MGRYIQGPVFGKAEHIIKEHGAEIIPAPPASFLSIPKGKALICVVENPMFEAAGFAFNQSEYECFTDKRDPRRKTWLLMDLEKAKEVAK